MSSLFTCQLHQMLGPCRASNFGDKAIAELVRFRVPHGTMEPAKVSVDFAEKRILGHVLLTIVIDLGSPESRISYYGKGYYII